ncbi:MAG TPA: GerAB/ArcD/ProY family transporter [Clostridia bacterium]|nr:GerAB/ArcD/ProY family transporter [Clostridia bacterium]
MNNTEAQKPKGLKAGTSREQATLMVFACGFSNIVFTFIWTVGVTGKPFWIAAFVGVLLNIPFGIWIFSFGKKFEGKNVFEIINGRLGRIVCGLVVLLYVSLNIVIIVCTINLFVGTVKVYFLETTPQWFIILLIVSMCALFANSGIKTFGWLIELLAILAVINYFSGFSLSFIREFKLSHILPVFDTTISRFTTGVFFTAGGAGEGLFFLMTMAGTVRQPHRHYRWVVKGFGAGALILSFAIFIMLGDEGIEVLSRIGHAGVTVARTLFLGQYIRGMEVFILMTYQYITVIRTTMVMSSCVQSINSVFSVKKRSWIILLVITLTVFSLSWYINSFNTAYYLACFLGLYVVMPLVIFILIIASVAAGLKKKEYGACEKAT